MMKALKLLTKVKSARLFTRTPAHKSSEALKLEAMSLLDSAVTHHEFREVYHLIGRIIHRFEEDDRFERQEAEARAKMNAPKDPNQNPGHNHGGNGKHHGNKNPNHNQGGGQKRFGNH